MDPGGRVLNPRLKVQRHELRGRSILNQIDQANRLFGRLTVVLVIIQRFSCTRKKGSDMAVWHKSDSGTVVERFQLSLGGATNRCALVPDVPSPSAWAWSNLNLLYGGPPRAQASSADQDREDQ